MWVRWGESGGVGVQGRVKGVPMRWRETEGVGKWWEKTWKDSAATVKQSQIVEQFVYYTQELGLILSAVGAMGGSAPGHIFRYAFIYIDFLGHLYTSML